MTLSKESVCKYQQEIIDEMLYAIANCESWDEAKEKSRIIRWIKNSKEITENDR